MSLAKSVYKYKKPLVLLAIMVLVYHLYKSSLIQEGLLSSSTQCSAFQNCKECVNNYNAGDPKVPCLWSNDKDNHGNIKGCSAFADRGFSRTCNQPTPGPNTCNKATNCQSCLSSNCFWGDTDQKCSSTFKAGYGKICSGNNPNPNCPKCETCPNLTLLKTPTFITTQ